MSPTLSVGKRFFLGSTLAASFLLAPPAFAQSAADKATARELASSGIKKFKAGDAAAAVKNLKKAQALYDAPIHLLYLARAHAELGELVEAAEAYRLLGRSELSSNAPRVFVQAKTDGAKELEKLEPRLARLTIEISPDEIEGLKVTMDDKKLNTAALGVGRATNPGKRTVRATAPGYKDAEGEIELSEGGSETLTLTLEKDPEAEIPVAAASTSGGTTTTDKSDDEPGTKAEHTGASDMGVLAGLRFGGVLPLGKLEANEEISEYSSVGFALRGEVGFRFLKYYGVKLFGTFGSLTPGSTFSDIGSRLPQGAVSDNKTSTLDFGASVFGTTQLGKFGGFGELGMSLVHNYSWTQNVAGRVGDDAINCKNEAKYSGWAMRAGGGVHIPVNGFINVVPNVDASLGQYSSRTATFGCSAGGDIVDIDLGDPDREIDAAMHFQVFLGVGGDFHFDL